MGPDRLAPYVSALSRLDQEVVALRAHDDHCGLAILGDRLHPPLSNPVEVLARALPKMASDAPEGALAGIRSLVSDSLSDMRTNGEPIPEPFGDRSYSGKFIVRVPPEVHRSLAIRAAEQGVSMNRLVSARLAREG